MLFIRPSILRRTTDIDYYSRKKYSIVQQGLVDAANSVGGKGNPLMRPYDELLNDNPPPPLSETPSTAQPVLPPMAPAKDVDDDQPAPATPADDEASAHEKARSEEHTSELQSLMRNSYADFCLKKKK